MDPVRVVVVGADPLARGGVAALLSSDPSVRVAGEAAPDGALRATVRALAPEVAAFDLGPGEAFADPIAGAVETGIPVVALLGSGSQAREALGAGARGLVLRGAPAGRLAGALRAVAEGLWVLDASVGDALLHPVPAEPAERLTPRELEFLGLLSEGLSNKAIAERLGISERTAKFHASSVLAKLGAENRAEAIVRAARLGLVAL